jgi:hypothetical protein
VKPPFDRAKLAEKNARDAADAITDAAAKTPEQRIAETLELSELVRALARANGIDPASCPSDLAEKARLWARPMRLLLGRF